MEGSRFFAQHNYEALKDPRLRLYIEDAKTFLKAIQRRYDIIVSEPSNPWIAGIGNLFTIEFYHDVKQRLQPDGLMVQWFHIYEMTDEILRLVDMKPLDLRDMSGSVHSLPLSYSCLG